MNLALSLIRLDGGTQPRAALNEETIAEYVNAMTDGAEFPPVIVFYDGTDYWLADGFHRFRAADFLARPEISADVRQGTRRDAILYSVGANATHGLRRTNADKRRAVMVMLQDQCWGTWSDRDIARRCAVDNSFVSRMRKELSVDRPQISERTVQRNGTIYAMNTAPIAAATMERTQAAANAEPPTYRQIWELEAGVRRWVKQFAPDEMLTLIHIAKKSGEGSRLFENLIESDKVPGPRTKGNLREACLNVLEQFRQEERRKQAQAQSVTDDTAPEPPLMTLVRAEDCRPAPAPEPPTPTLALGDQRAVGDVTVYCHDSRYLDEIIDDGSVQMVITSPPYNVGIDYANHNDNLAMTDYADLLYDVFTQSFHALCDGGRIAVVVPFGVGRNPWRPLASEVLHTLTVIGFEVRGQIVWDKGTSGNRTTWGSWRLPTNPSLRDTTECILVAHKGAAALAVPQGALDADGYSPWLPSEEFMSLACDRWTVAPASAQAIGHPAPFPVRLVEMLMRFYAYKGAHVLDPFAGSGTVGVTAARLGCRASLVEISPAYCELAIRRVENNI